MSRPKPPDDDFRPQDQPIAWCVEILLSDERGNFERAAIAQHELARLGWELKPLRGRKPEGVANV
jgi:hypothetical protein